MVSTWNQLAACPGDPGRLSLDSRWTRWAPRRPERSAGLCAQSAMDEAAFEGRLAARRGLPVMEQPQNRCRQRTDGAGRASLETRIKGMFAPAGTPR